MALTRTLAQMEARVRYLADTGGTSGVARHPQADIFDSLNTGVAKLSRLLREVAPDQRFVGSLPISLLEGVSLYSLPTDILYLLSADVYAEGARRWILPFDLAERPDLVAPNAEAGVPRRYRIEGSDIEVLPVPATDGYVLTIWYTPHTTELSGSAAFDTVDRLDEYPVLYAVAQVAKRDRLWELHDRAQNEMAQIEQDVRVVARSRDVNAPGRMLTTRAVDRFGVPRG